LPASGSVKKQKLNITGRRTQSGREETIIITSQGETKREKGEESEISVWRMKLIKTRNGRRMTKAKGRGEVTSRQKGAKVGGQKLVQK